MVWWANEAKANMQSFVQDEMFLLFLKFGKQSSDPARSYKGLKDPDNPGRNSWPQRT